MQDIKKLFENYSCLRDRMVVQLVDAIEEHGLTQAVRQRLKVSTILSEPQKKSQSKAKPVKRSRGPCEVPGCARLQAAKGLCKTHWDRNRKGKDLGGPLSLTKAQKAAQSSILDRDVNADNL